MGASAQLLKDSQINSSGQDPWSPALNLSVIQKLKVCLDSETEVNQWEHSELQQPKDKRKYFPCWGMQGEIDFSG